MRDTCSINCSETALSRQFLQASGKELVLVSRLTVFVWAVWMGGLLAVLNAAGVNVYWLGIWNGVVASGTAQLARFSIRAACE